MESCPCYDRVDLMTRILPTPARRENGSRVLVTGAAGWTAVAILKALRRAGYEIVALDLPAAARNQNLLKLADHVVLADIASFPDVVDAARAITAIIHLAVAHAEGADHVYGLTKRLQEEIAKDFCVTFGMNTIALRAGHIVDGRAGVDPHGRPLAEVDYARGGRVCRHDLARTCVQALPYPRSGYDAFHVI